MEKGTFPLTDEISDEKVRATLAICTLNRRADLVRTLQEIEKQESTSVWELLVIDNGSHDGALEIARSFEKKGLLPMRVLTEPRRGVSYARNRALQEGRGEILVFVDDDVDCDPKLLDAHLKAFNDLSIQATGGRIVPLLPDSTPSWLRASLHEETGGPTTRYDYGDEVREIRIKGEYAMPISCNLGLRRSLALELGGFRTDLGFTPTGQRIGGEDTELMVRIGKAGGRVLYLPDARVVHRVQPERATKVYYRTWNVAYGRASIKMREQPGILFTLVRVVEQMIRILRYTVLPFSLISDSRAKRYRKRYQALGRILELLRIRWEP